MHSLSCRTFTTTRFVVVACGLEPRPYLTEAEAMREALVAARRTGWADYYRVVGEPVTNLWREPELLGGFEREDGSAGDQAAA